jgi:hypothetical protein
VAPSAACIAPQLDHDGLPSVTMRVDQDRDRLNYSAASSRRWITVTGSMHEMTYKEEQILPPIPNREGLT